MSSSYTSELGPIPKVIFVGHSRRRKNTRILFEHYLCAGFSPFWVVQPLFHCRVQAFSKAGLQAFCSITGHQKGMVVGVLAWAEFSTFLLLRDTSDSDKRGPRVAH